MKKRELSIRGNRSWAVAALRALALLVLLPAGFAHAQLRNVDLAFRPPTDTRVVGFHVYIASVSRAYGDYRDNINFIPPPDGSGVAHFPLTGIEQFQNVYISLKSYDADGKESPFSNELTVPAQQQCLVTGCNDNNACTTDTCTATGCRFDPAPLVGSTCNDNNAMTFDDMCRANGSCSGTVAQCNVDADCGASADMCAGPKSCVAHMCQATAPLPDETTCSDGNAATKYDVCRAGVCRGFACGSDSQCSDGNACTADTCSANVCRFNAAPLVGSTCNDNNAMTFDDMCRSNGTCGGTVAQCNVDADCGAPADMCSGPKSCVAHMCQPGTPLPNETSCNDNNAATKYDVCRSGVCRGFACGSDSQCSDGAACNGSERCVANSCVAGTPMVCGDGNQCNGTETCVGSACVAGAALQCPTDDGPCFDAFCDPTQGCRVQIHPDGEMCATAMSGSTGQCTSGVCVAMPTDPPPPTDPNDAHTPRPPPVSPNESCANVLGAPVDVRQELTEHPELERKLVWEAPAHPMGSLLQWRWEALPTWNTLRAVAIKQNGCTATYSVTLTGLTSGVGYRYRVSGAGANDYRVWSEIFMMRAGPGTPKAGFRFAFFADNGLDSTPQSPLGADVLTQIRAGTFPLVLGGGGYTLSNEAIAAGSATNATQAVALWKLQAKSVIANSLFAPALGDTEVASFAHAETASDYSAYTPLAGTAQTPYQSYSYDFGATHFLAVNAPTFGTIHPSTAEGAAHLAWIDADLAAARARGARWIVIYMHSDLFSSEKQDAPQAAIRNALGPILARHQVNLVLSGEGDSYERTKGMRGNTLAPASMPDPGVVTTATDGTVFVRAGSGGRTVFQPWLRTTQPIWSVFRDNTYATWVTVTVSDKSLLLVTYGIDAKGKKVILDKLKVY